MRKFKTDLFIASRNTQLLADVNFKDHFNVDKVCLWTHDLPASYVFDKLPQAIPNIDKVFALTEWHQQEIKDKFPEVPEEYWFFAHNGVDVSLYKKPEKRNPYKLIYSSTPFRGLDVLLEVFPKIKEFVPEAELHVFSSMKVYGDDTDETKEWEALYEKAQNTDGVVYHGTVIRKERAKHM
jgi:glycosyltransferase involved in cell wall biosynthesis